MFATRLEILAPNVHKHIVTRRGDPIAYGEVLTLWQHDEQFRTFFLAQLAASPFTAFRWETPPITTATTHRPFEFVLRNAPGLIGPADRQAFASHFTDDAANEGVVAFQNLGGDAILVAPSPRGPDAAYGHIAAFVRYAPVRQQHSFWRTIFNLPRADRATRARSDRPPWVSTAGGGVAWLHVRLDSRPKYYGHAPYRGLYSEPLRRR